VIMSGRGGI